MTAAKRRLNGVLLGAMIITILCLVCLGIFFNTGTAYASPGEITYKVAHLSDTHIYIEEYCNRSSTRYARAFNSDAKLMEESTAAIQAALDRIFEEKPDVLVISGDLTSNAEYDGHVRLAEMLADLAAKMRAINGYEHFQILVTPGNHDLYNSYAASYMPTQDELDSCATEDEKQQLLSNYFRAARTTSSADFAEIYRDFGFSGGHLYFYESDYWYQDMGDSADNNPFETRVPPQSVIDAFKAGNDAYELLAPYAKTGSLSYIARTPGATFVMFDTHLRTYEGGSSLDGWEHKTGGMITDAMLKWAIESTAIDREENRPVIVVAHQNFLPHFAMEDKLLKDFTILQWEKVVYTLADAGIRYGLSGHMHSFDIATYVTQNGNVFFDFETGSPISYASGFRLLEINTNIGSNTYTENVYSTVISNDTSITYSIPYYNPDTGLIERQSYTVENLLDYLDEHQTEMIPKLLDGYLDETFILGMLTDMLAGLKDAMGLGDTLYNLAMKFVNDLASLNLDRPVFSDGYNAGSTYTFDGQPDSGYHLFDLVKDMVNWLVLQDMTFGLADAPYTLSDAAAEIYKKHMSGADTDTMSQNLQYLVTQCDNGTIVNFLFDTLTDFLFPQLDIITTAPIRTKQSTPALASGAGFDIADELKAFDSLPIAQRLLGAAIKGLIVGDNLFQLVTNLADKIPSFLANSVVAVALNTFGFADTVDKYVGTVMSYIEKLSGNDSITAFIQAEVLDKYATDALKVNLGTYVGLIIKGWAVDYTPDGSYQDNSTERAWNVINETRFHVVYSATAFEGNSYFIDHSVEGSGSLDVTPTIANGLLPSMLSHTFGGDVTTTKEFKWYTKIQQDIFNPDYVPASYIRYWTGSDTENAVTIAATSANVQRDIPLIDLGIAYLTKAIHIFNLHTVSLADLDPGTLYFYQVGSDNYGWSDTYVFKTGAESGSFTVLALTDIQGSVERNYLESLESIRLALNTVGSPAFIISAGDNVDKGSSTYQWQWLLDGQREIWANNSLVTASGNHENDDDTIANFLALPSDIAVSSSGHYYSYDYSNTHFVILNTNDLASDNKLSAAQTEWLIADLAANKANPATKWTIVTLHKGPYTAGSHAFDSDVIALRAQLSSIFVEGGVNLVLQGHDHTYSVSKYIGADGKVANVTFDDRGAAIVPEAVMYINLGTIGDKYYKYIYHDDVYLMDRKAKDYAKTPLAAYFVNGNLELEGVPTFMDLTIDDNNIKVTTYAIINGSAVIVDRIIISDVAEYYGLSAGEIAAIVIASVVGAAGIGFAIFWFLVRKKKYVA